MRAEEKCNFCEETAELRLSHVIPKFVYSWAKKTSPGYLRCSKNPNVRIQDGEKKYLLCSNCEELFSKWEKHFSETIFKPLHNSGNAPFQIRYKDWFLKFCVSVSWRILLYHKFVGLGHLSKEQIRYADKAYQNWHKFLVGKTPHPGEFQQHVIILDIIESHNVPGLSPYINRYFLRGIDFDVICSETMVMTYAKMCRIALFGFIQFDERNKWKGTKIHVKEGKIGAKDCHISESIFNFLSDRADQVSKGIQKISQKQSDKIEDTIFKRLDKVRKSDILKAMTQDVVLFGDKALGKD